MDKLNKQKAEDIRTIEKLQEELKASQDDKQMLTRQIAAASGEGGDETAQIILELTAAKD